MDGDALAALPLSALADLEGLIPWEYPARVQHIIASLEAVGLRTIGELSLVSMTQFRARWGELGISLWKRLQGRESQVISPLEVAEVLYEYGYFDNSIQHLPLLLHPLEQALTRVFARIERLGRFAKSLELILHCEYSKASHRVAVEPVNPSRDLRLFLDLLAKRLEKIDLLNPVREFEINVYDVPEKIYQMDFFDAVDPNADKWRRLISFSRQLGVEIGFLQVLPAHFPEESFRFRTDWPSNHRPQDFILHEQNAIQVRSVYAKSLARTPRPPLILKKPLPLQKSQVKTLKIMSSIPCERIDGEWWTDWKDRFRALREKAKLLGRAGAAGTEPAEAGVSVTAEETSTAETKKERPPARDYYFAVSAEGRWLWIFQEHQSKRFFLHGYFD